MGFDLVRIATSANGLKVPIDAKCCFCKLLLEEGIALSGCGHSACYACMAKRVKHTATCPIDGVVFQANKYRFLPLEIEDWLFDIKLKCRWFDGRYCTATGIALRNVRRHEDICRNNPLNTTTVTTSVKTNYKLVPKREANQFRRTDSAFNSKPRSSESSAPVKAPKKCDTTKIEEWIRDLTLKSDVSPPKQVVTTTASIGQKTMGVKKSLTPLEYW